MKNSKIFKRRRNVIRVFLLFALVVAFCGILLRPTKAYAEQLESVELKLYAGNPEGNLPFSIKNMLPGDSVTQLYKLSVSYTGTIAVHFQIDGVDDVELGKEIDICVALSDTNQVLYEGKLADIPELVYTATTENATATDILSYLITVSLSDSVGNEFQGKSLNFKLLWWTEGSLVPPPHTGDVHWPYFCLFILSITVTALVVLGLNYRKPTTTDDRKNVVSHKKWISVVRRIFFAVGFVLCLGVTTLALTSQMVSIEGNTISTGIVKVVLNDGKPVFDKNIVYEPGKKIQKTFTIQNVGNVDVYYRLWLSGVEGNLANDITLEISDGEKIIFSGVLKDMLGEKAGNADGTLAAGQTKVLMLTVFMPVDAGNDVQGTFTWFDLNLDAVQKANNPGEKFQ